MRAKEYFTSHDDLDFNTGIHDVEIGQHSDTTMGTNDAQEQPRVNENGNISEPLKQNLPSICLGPASRDFLDEPGLPPSGAVVELLENPHQIKASRRDFYNYFWTEGNWTDLAATSLNWMVLDFTFYLLGVNSSSFVPTMFGEKDGPDQPPYGQLIRNERHIMEATSIGAIIGSLIAISVMNKFSRRKIQLWGFIILGGLFIVVGSMYVTLPTTKAHLGIVIFYGLCQLFYNLGECERIEYENKSLPYPKVQTLLRSSYVLHQFWVETFRTLTYDLDPG